MTCAVAIDLRKCCGQIRKVGRLGLDMLNGCRCSVYRRCVRALSNFEFIFDFGFALFLFNMFGLVGQQPVVVKCFFL